MGQTGASKSDRAAQRLCESAGKSLPDLNAAQPSSCPLTRLCKGSTAVVAVICFLAVNYWAATYKAVPAAHLNAPDQSWVGWAVNDFLKSAKRPNIVFFGSSLVLVPLAGNDANYLNKKLDGSKHHSSKYFEDRLKNRTGYNISNYIFALPGEMPSDAYLLTNMLLKGDKRPDVIVYGVGPRDFMDNLLPSPSATDPFRVMRQFGSVDQTVSLSMPDWQTRLDYELGKLLSLYGKKDNLDNSLISAATQWINNMVPPPKGTKPITAFERRQLLPSYRPNELNAGDAYFRPETPEDKKKGIFDNLAEYRKRYAEMRWDTFVTQMDFFADLLNVAHARGIRVIVMAMPITDVNRSLIADGSFDAYMFSLKALCQAKGACFIKLHDSGNFINADFMDTVHLNPDGGRKMLDYLVENIRSDSQTLSSLNQEKKEIQLVETKLRSLAATNNGKGRGL